MAGSICSSTILILTKASQLIRMNEQRQASKASGEPGQCRPEARSGTKTESTGSGGTKSKSPGHLGLGVRCTVSSTAASWLPT
jgi:hypothetical protein